MTVFPIPQPCLAPRLPGLNYKYRGYLIALVPAVNPDQGYTHCAGDGQEMRYTVDALIELTELDKGKLVQVPLFEVTLRDWTRDKGEDQ